MTREDAEEFVRQLDSVDWPMNRVVIIGGEPSLHPNLDDFVDIAYDAVKTPVWLLTHGFTKKAKAIVERYTKDPRVHVVGRTIKPNGSVVHRNRDFWLAPADKGASRRPCLLHTALVKKGKCGISVDAKGYTFCAIGGMIDGVLNLGARTKQLADLFNPEFAKWQTETLCNHCGSRWGRNRKWPEAEMVGGVPMSPLWANAVRKHNGKAS
jgi:hypothetical protein